MGYHSRRFSFLPCTVVQEEIIEQITDANARQCVYVGNVLSVAEFCILLRY
jgi:hypothetical protein